MAPSLVDNIVNEAQGTLRFSWLMPNAPHTQQQADAVQQAINRLPMLKNTLASNDHQAIAIYLGQSAGRGRPNRNGPPPCGLEPSAEDPEEGGTEVVDWVGI